VVAITALDSVAEQDESSAHQVQRRDPSRLSCSVSVSISGRPFRSNRAAEELKTSVMPTATVIRDGAWQEIPVRTAIAVCLIGWRLPRCSSSRSACGSRPH
jgi:hypothetical protein